MMNISRTLSGRCKEMLASPAWMFFALPWLMALLAAGTVAQRFIGLYASQKLFFGSFILWVGPVPLPGAYTILLLISINLLAKLLFKSKLQMQYAGVILVHISAVVLLCGGLLSTLGREDGYIVLADGDSASSVSDYQKTNLLIERNETPVAALPLSESKSLVEGGAPFSVRLIHYCYPCALTPRSAGFADGRGAATKLELQDVPPKPEESKNLHGALVEVKGAGAGQDGVYLAFDAMDNAATLKLGADNYSMLLRPVARDLPFTIRLLHFTRANYPGTQEARDYHSQVTVTDGALKWQETIGMNQPLRYKGYTLYQSSFVEDGPRLLSVIAVVKNAGEWFPYIALGMLCLGLVLHTIIVMRSKLVL